ncbi:hypothetical protein LOZ61_001479 [Ophidiomyces ophidiicola]|nr:hypothetical protein LOZ61_001479 [Ophidiomyces ophidiicola]KAI1930420.1 hypothetical protein LOZ60_000979 [Ophidiomyces ophidiicola]KAI1967281.1 hypothetical protein LOZ59_000941 [Ophidiomyces ophidiicola]KAI1975040.1 hypothetical protein LOZ56_000831 [Ophidiomyces ophidiicola]KAI2036365.1 hypothetical protein LOZ48_000982 [Ophidiomyces ophidiicola]
MIPPRLWFHIGVITAAVVLAMVMPGRKWLLSSATEQVHVSKFTTEANSTPSTLSSRHQDAKQHLLHQLQRPEGEFSQYHPRYRLLAALHGFYRYRTIALNDLNTIKDRYNSISKEQQGLIENSIKYNEKIRRTEQLIDENDKVAQKIVDYGLEYYNINFSELQSFINDVESAGHSAERVSVLQALKHYVRDWAPEGEHERISSFPQILGTLEMLYPERNASNPLQVLVPGSGLGRLAHNIAGLNGFEVIANEWSTFMNLAYRYVTSPKAAAANSSTVYPYIDWWSHQPTTEELFRPVTFPAVSIDPSSVVLVEGDFTREFEKPCDNGKFDVIVTLFFIDTARNILTYIETIHRLLKPGGIWINLGPFLYGSAPYLQLSLDETISVAEAAGFEFKDTDSQYGELSLPNKKARQMEAPYGFNNNTLSKNAYRAQFWVASRR